MGAAVQPIYLFELAFQRAQWLSVRQTAVAENVVNANTPNFRARDVEPFEATLDKTALSMSSTKAGHISLASATMRTDVGGNKSFGISKSGNDVSLEKELMKAGEVSRDYALNVSIVKSFHRMWMASVKG